MSVTFAFEYGLCFAALTATISHVVLFHGEMILEMWKKTTSSLKNQLGDVHTRIMKKNYEQVPEWWFVTILILMFMMALVACEGFGKQLQLPWWGILLSLAIALVFTLPIGVIEATTNIRSGLNVITELVIGYIYPGKPLANVAFKTYGHISMVQALGFLEDLKLGHYMKIPPKSMFIVQLVGTVVASSVHFGTAWWLLTSIENICDESLLPKGSPWTCPGDDVFYSASIIWGVVGASDIPPVRSVNYITWGIVGMFFNFYVYRKFKAWWARHTYILSAGLDAGVAFMGLVLYFTLQSYGIFGPTWWGLEADHCPLAACPTAPGVYAEG
ncbi:oligopeptide transporter OPT family protein, partial [Trifolium medium]|nr:oligopeptide transporter OPT family protein [Trifolium medium]